ncbi:hypothetical protein RRF68_06145 [Tenacibaculum sp. HL-MS23]|uniref:hypothetical protein n=1 Tax=Tenacibaculum TaxID=104267 RepID=UPI0023B14B63|nr:MULTISPECIES: hypothetical protein [Tenacibaculum]WNW02976.1 hypothetical protein RRF68_06145 [Tenacibaculum sp. HL-MS23]
MKNTIICCCLILTISCKKQSVNPVNLIVANNVATQYTTTQTPLNYFDSQKRKNSEPYKLKLASKKLQNNEYDLSISMELFDNAHFISPNAKREFKGKFKVVFNTTDKFSLLGKLIEKPLSVEEYDEHPFTNGTVNWVRKNTTYRQKIKLNSTKNFQIKGYIQFTIEPRCTLEKISFIIKQVNGKMSVELFGC